MCLMAFALHTQPDLALLLAANRDESLDRPTAAWHTWRTPAGTPVRAGRDLRDGGTWIGCAGSRIALLTNVRDATAFHKAPRSRGELALSWLDTSRTHPHDAPAALHHLLHHTPLREASVYGGFNLVLGDVQQAHWVWLNNRPRLIAPQLPPHLQALTQQVQAHLLQAELPAGVYGLSNAGLDTPWPKTQRLSAHLQQCLHADLQAPTNPLWPELWPCLRDATIAPDADLPHTGVPLAWERALSAIWVDVPATAHPPAGYGTRSSLVLEVRRNAQGWRARAEERTWRPAAVPPVQALWLI